MQNITATWMVAEGNGSDLTHFLFDYVWLRRLPLRYRHHGLPIRPRRQRVGVTQGRGSRVQIHLKGVRAVFHEPHPEKETDKGALRSVREFLENAGITEGEDNADL